MENIALISSPNILVQNILELLSLRGYTKENVAVFAPHVQGKPKISFGDEDLTVQPLESIKIIDFAVAVFLGAGNQAAQYAPKFAAAGVKVINATTALAGMDDIPMIVGGVNDEALARAKNIINIPQPPVVHLLGALAGLSAKYTVKNIRLSAYISADMEGQDGMSELYNHTRRILMNDMPSSANGLFHKTLAFNVIPQAGAFIGEETLYEWLYNSQIKQVLGDKTKVHANCAVVPAFVGLGVFANIETLQDIDADEAREYIKKAKGVLVLDKQEDGGYASLTDVQGENSIFISRIRQDMTVENGISLWIAGDSLKIAAQNILALLKQFLKKDK